MTTTLREAAQNRTTVDSGALKMALNVLRRAGKNEIADELEKTAIRAAQPQQEPDEAQELRTLCDMQADILSRTAVALRGTEPPLTKWSHHDLPERAAAAIAAIDVMQRAAKKLAKPKKPKDCPHGLFDVCCQDFENCNLGPAINQVPPTNQG